jgi:thioredoxin
MQVVVCSHCGTKNRIDESRLETSEAKCGRCGEKLEGIAVSANEQDSTPINITDQTFEREVLQVTGRPVLVDCWAPWCPPCKMIAPILDQLAAESRGSYRIAKLDVDQNPQISSRFQISSIPTMLIFKDGKLVDRLVGAHPKPTIAERLRVASRFAA